MQKGDAMALHQRYKNDATPWFSDQNRINAWRDVEAAVLHARFTEHPENPEFMEAANALAKIGDVDVGLKEKFEKETKHDLVAACRAMAKQVDDLCPGKNYGRLIHQGITSYDTEDTAESLLFARAGQKTVASLKELHKALMSKAQLFKYAPCNGYTHSQVAEPITIGKRFLNAAVWIFEQIEEFERKVEGINQCKIKGATGIYSGSLSPKFEAMVAKKLRQKVSKAATQIQPIEDLLPFFNPLVTIACTIENLMYSLCLSSGDLAEVKEDFSPGQTGSSVMTFKQNPINLENVIGACRKIKALNNELSFATLSLRERDISGSFQVVRHIIPEVFETTEHLSRKTQNIVNKIGVFPPQAARGVNKYGDFLFAGAAKDFIAMKFSGADNKEIYSLIQKYSIECKNSSDWRGKAQSLFDALAPKVREIGGDDAAAELKTVMSLPYNLRNVRECYHVAADINNDFAVGDVTVHEELAKYIIDGGQMKQFTKEDFENFINMYEQIVRANYKACDGGDVRASPVEYAGFELALNLLRGQLKNTYQSNAKQ